MNEVNLVFPHQLFKNSPLIDNSLPFLLIEEELFFNQYNFHKQKIAYQRATMRYYREHLNTQEREVQCIESIATSNSITDVIRKLSSQHIKKVHVINPLDNWLERRMLDYYLPSHI